MDKTAKIVGIAKTFGLFAEQQKKTITWNSTGGITNIIIKSRSVIIGQGKTGEVIINVDGDYIISYEVNANERGTYAILSNGISVGSGNNYTSPIQDVACVEYAISSGDCRNNFTKRNRITYRRKYKYETIKSGSVRVTQYKYAYHATEPVLPITWTNANGYTFRSTWEAAKEIVNNYYCDPNPGCTESKVVESFEPQKTGNFSFRISTPEVKAELERLERERILSMSRYEVITPLVNELIGGKIVPRLQYVKVIDLTPAQANSYIYRGYFVSSVASTVPTYRSRAYGTSLVARGDILKKMQSIIPLQKKGTLRRVVGGAAVVQDQEKSEVQRDETEVSKRISTGRRVIL